MSSPNSAIKLYLSKVDSIKNSAEFVSFISNLLNDSDVYVFGEFVENDKIKSVCQTKPASIILSCPNLMEIL
jgi:hypothetical protein